MEMCFRPCGSCLAADLLAEARHVLGRPRENGTKAEGSAGGAGAGTGKEGSAGVIGEGLAAEGAGAAEG